jgi:hypothetical protein
MLAAKTSRASNRIRRMTATGTINYFSHTGWEYVLPRNDAIDNSLDITIRSRWSLQHLLTLSISRPRQRRPCTLLNVLKWICSLSLAFMAPALMRAADLAVLTGAQITRVSFVTRISPIIYGIRSEIS